MPTLEELERRVTELERLLPTLSTGRSPEFRELEARVYEQIDALRQQLAEQQRQMVVDRNATNTLLNRTDQLQSDFRTLQTTMNQQFADVRQDLHLIIEMFRAQQTQLDHQQTQLAGVQQEVAEVRQEMAGVRQDMNGRFSAQDAKFDQVLQQLTAITMKLDQGR